MIITGVVVAWGLIGLFLVAVPLAAWWIGGRPFWARAGGRNGLDELHELRRSVLQRHNLRPLDVPRVEAAVTWGRALDTPQLRAASVDWAQRLIELNRSRRAARPRLRAVFVVVLVLWATTFVARLAFVLGQGRWGDVRWDNVVLYAGAAVLGWWLTTGPRRAIERNSGPVPP